MAYQPETSLPCISPEFQASLVCRLLEERRYGDAIKLAKLSNYSEDSVDNLPVLLTVFADDGLTELQRAEIMWECGNMLRITDGGAAWSEMLETAAGLYNEAGHATGALDIRIDQIWHARDGSASVDEDTAELWRIMEAMEAVGNWASARRCLSAIIHINSEGHKTPPGALQIKVEKEWLRVADICGIKTTTESGAIAQFLAWPARSSQTVGRLDFLERFYERIKDCDATAVLGLTLIQLCELYKSIGDDDKARKCVTRRPVLPRWLMIAFGADPFKMALEAATEAPDTELELKMLRDELQEVQATIQNEPTVLVRTHQIKRLSDLCAVYISQQPFRCYEQLERLVECLESVIDAECDKLEDQWQATIWRATALQNRAELLEFKPRTLGTMEEMQGLALEVTECYELALGLYESSGHAQTWRAATAKRQVATKRRLLWQHNGRLAESRDFTLAATLYAEAAGIGPLKSQQIACLELLRHWVEGYQARVDVDPAIFQPSSAYQMAVKWANEADRLASIQRNDLSALPRERAVLAKQMLSDKPDPGTDFHSIALLLHKNAGDNLGAWNWLQRSKARSISDMLGLGINIPHALKHAIGSDASLARSCKEEQALSQEIRAAPDDRQFLLRTQLELHRNEMRQNPILKQLLDYREGRPTSLERLQNISVKTSPDSTRRIFYIDWLIDRDRCTVFIASSAGVDSFQTEVTVPEVAAWKAQYLGASPSGEHPLDKSDTKPLQELSGLIQEIVRRTEPKDILVFCPSGVLHGVPLHAATIARDSTQVLLERNPVVYVASMTIFEQCVAKETERASARNLRGGGGTSRSYVAVYESTETAPLDERGRAERDETYAAVRTVAARRQPDGSSAAGSTSTAAPSTTTTTALGSEATRERLEAAFQADYMCFIGHCKSSSTNVLQQGLVLCENDSDKDSNSNSDSVNSTSREDRFTASDMLGINVQTSCLALLACGSTHEAHGPGDEPLGIASALLCAGATSVVGTMWKVRVNTARLVLDRLDRNLDGSSPGESGGGGHGGGLVDLAVAVQSVALRLKRRHAEETNHTSQWAAFMLYGSWFMAGRAPSG